MHYKRISTSTANILSNVMFEAVICGELKSNLNSGSSELIFPTIVLVYGNIWVKNLNYFIVDRKLKFKN
jgi:hypothetical protein